MSMALSSMGVGDSCFQVWGESYNPHAATLFRECDAVHDEDGNLTGFEVSSTRMLDRLELLGIDLSKTSRAFNQGYQEVPVEDRQDSFDFDTWLESGKDAVRKAGYFSYEDAGNSWIDHVVDIRYITRAFIEMYVEDVPVTWTLADLVIEGFAPPDSTLCEMELAKTRDATVSAFSVIVLTEGSTDASMLQGALSLIYPHLSDFLKFMDFGVGPEGGAAAQLRALKAFAACGVANRVIAIFDNDTAASEVLASLTTPLPGSFRILRYPDIDLGRKYPTLGPQGSSDADINGRVGALELYFGRDILAGPTGALTPIRWTGFSKKQGEYQGEFVEKSRLQAEFRSKLNDAISRGSLDSSEDWSGMISILDCLRHAYSESA